jgi:hypothetical protein
VVLAEDHKTVLLAAAAAVVVSADAEQLHQAVELELHKEATVHLMQAVAAAGRRRRELEEALVVQALLLYATPYSQSLTLRSQKSQAMDSF